MPKKFIFEVEKTFFIPKRGLVICGTPAEPFAPRSVLNGQEVWIERVIECGAKARDFIGTAFVEVEIPTPRTGIMSLNIWDASPDDIWVGDRIYISAENI
jgi:hypothetical protein